MYVCICNGVTDRQIGQAIDNGACSLACLSAELGLATQCGKCASYANKMLNDRAAGNAAMARPSMTLPPVPISQPA